MQTDLITVTKSAPMVHVGSWTATIILSCDAPARMCNEHCTEWELCFTPKARKGFMNGQRKTPTKPDEDSDCSG